jgi:translation initiation factor 2 alpha subunit (eIF-2alpha)
MTDRRLKLETEAAQRLKDMLVATYGADDADTARDMIEGETSLHEAIASATLELAAVEGEKEGIEIAIAKLRARLTRYCNRAEGIRAALQAAMETAELTSLKTPAATLSVRASPPRVEIIDAASIPALFMVQPPPSPDKKAISAALKAKEAVPGCVLSNQPLALSVRFN